ncbi:MAG: right-handed parallel beta-helix repeat-containing protein [Caulobacterales bacterium]|nr:right-handed parallel beta-helix repeat-containing protein [Caulobacterales bacterium]
MGQGWNRALSALTLTGALALAACGPGGGSAAKPNTTYQETLIQQLIDAKPGDVITIPAGVYAIDRGLSLDIDGVTIKGAGMDKTILTFKGQAAGAEGLLVNASNFTIEDLAIEDAKGDALKVNEGENIVIRRVRTEWTGGPKTSNGAYGIYPVQVRNLLIEESVAIGASDAGIYVGQSDNVVVRRNRAEFNVAGIEIENTRNADVYDNLATNNTGGILVFNMPNLKVSGFATRIFRNRVEGNNTKNFGRKGSAVASVPAGTGVIINSNDQVEIFDNDIGGNDTSNVIISSYYSTGYMNQKGVEANFDAYPEAIFVHDNRFTPGGAKPDGLDLQALRVALFGVTGRLPDVLWDGYVDVKKFKGGKVDPALAVCVDNGAAQTLNADGPHKNKSPALAGESVRCRLAPLPAISVAAAGPVPAERKVPAPVKP